MRARRTPGAGQAVKPPSPSGGPAASCPRQTPQKPFKTRRLETWAESRSRLLECRLGHQFQHLPPRVRTQSPPVSRHEIQPRLGSRSPRKACVGFCVTTLPAGHQIPCF